MVKTEEVGGDPDDPAIWVHPVDAARSRVITTTKSSAPQGALVVFDLDGRIVQVLKGIDRPNNVDVEYGLKFGDGDIDVAVATARNDGSLRVFRIDRDSGELSDISAGGLEVFHGETGARKRPMGVALYKRPADGQIFVFMSRKDGPANGYLWQYRLEDAGQGLAKITFVRAFGAFSGKGEIEAIAVDDELGYVYYADEGAGLRKYAADARAPDAARELALFGERGWRGDREGIAILDEGGGRGLIVATDQIRKASRFHTFAREGSVGDPHRHVELRVVETANDETDGIEIVSTPLGPRFPSGLFAAMNSKGRNFFFYRAGDLK